MRKQHTRIATATLMFRSRRKTEPETLAKVRERYEDTSQVIFKDMVAGRKPNKRASRTISNAYETAGADRELTGSGVEQRTIVSDRVQSKMCVVS